jgi:hypothetical protein
MSTKRVPISRSPKGRISDAALTAFERLQALELLCSCPPRNGHDEYWKFEPCAACDGWWDEHNILHREIGAKPWEWPCVQSPAVQNPWPEGSYMDSKWEPNVEAQERYRQLEAALAESNNQ